MSERRVLGLLLFLSAVSAPLRGQDLAALKRHEAELTTRLAQLQAEARATAEQRFETERRSVVSAGPLHVAFPEWAAGEVTDRLQLILEAQHRKYGDAAEALGADTLFIGVDETERVAGSTAVLVGWRLGGLRGEQFLQFSGADQTDWVAFGASVALQRWSEGLIDTSMKQWLGALDTRATVEALRDPLVRDLVGSPSSRARRCLNGPADECRLLLELGRDGSPLLDAYDRTDLPEVLDRMGLDPRIPGRANCIGKRDPAACADLVREGRVLPPHPVSARARQSLFAYALSAGGEGAWLRLSRARGLAVADQLSAAAGRPIDTLVAGWQHDLLEGRRTTTADLLPSLILACLWSVVTTLFFAWRYRWRHV